MSRIPGSNRALLVVDVQEGLVAKKLYEKERFLGAVRGAIERFRNARELIVFVRHDGAAVKRGTAEWELYSGFARLPDDPIVDKTHGNAFHGTGLAELLKSRGVGRVVVCGLVSHGCVRLTCLGARDLGFVVDLLACGHANWAKDAAERIEKAERELAAAGIKKVGIDRL